MPNFNFHTSNALGDGIYLFSSGGDTITNNNCSSNHVFGISLYNSPNTMIASNTMRANEQIGVRLRDSDGCTLTYNTFSGNGQPGKQLEFPPAAPSFGQVGILLGSNNIRACLNNFVYQSTPMSGDQSVIWNSPQKLTYTYNGATHTGYLGNCYSDYNGSDTNGTGIGSPAASTGDHYPLKQPFEHYVGNSAAPAAQHSSSMVGGNMTSLINSAALSFTQRFGVGSAFLAFAAVAFVLLFLRVRRR
ncbi:MAG: NosD domain-containing protein [Halobacteriota archaeon]